MPKRQRLRPKGIPDRTSMQARRSGGPARPSKPGQPAQSGTGMATNFDPSKSEDFSGSPAERLDEIQSRLLAAREEIETRLGQAGLIPEPELTIEVFDEGDNVVCVADCPGVKVSDVSARVESGRVCIDARVAKGPRHGAADLPSAVMGEPMVAVRNGVVEVRLRKQVDQDKEQSETKGR